MQVDGAQQLLEYSVQNAGCCKILLHPSWSSAVYPATIFTTAPAGMITEELLQGCRANLRLKIEAYCILTDRL